MSMTHGYRGLAALSAILAALALGACSSSFGSGSSPPQHTTVVAPACPNGGSPPCP